MTLSSHTNTSLDENCFVVFSSGAKKTSSMFVLANDFFQEFVVYQNAEFVTHR